MERDSDKHLGNFNTVLDKEEGVAKRVVKM